MPKDSPNGFFDTSSPIALVAGGAGFVGSFICESLLEKSVKVICVDNWQTGLKDNINHLLLNKNFLLLESDVTKNLFSQIKQVDYIFHLAGVEAYLNGEDVSIETLESNSIGSKNLLDLAENHNAKFLLVSTIYIYSAKISQDRISSYFGKTREEEGEFSHLEAKRFAEALTSEYGLKKKVDVRIVRLGDVYGPRMVLSSNGIISRIVKQAIYKEALEVPGDRSLHIYPVFVQDAVEGIIKSLFGGGTKNSIISLAGPKSSVFSAAEIIKNAKPDVLDIKFDNKNFPLNKEVEAEVLYAGNRLISWKPTTTLEEGISQTVDWFSQKFIPPPMVQPKPEPKVEKKNIWKHFPKRTIIGENSPKKPKVDESKNNFWEESQRLKGIQKSPFKKENRRAGGLVFVSFIALFLVSALVFLFPFFWLTGGAIELSMAKSKLLEGDTQKASVWSERSISWFENAQSGFLRWREIPGLKNESRDFSKKSRILAKSAGVVSSASSVYKKTKSFVESLVGSGVSSQDLAQETSIELKSLSNQIGFLETDLASDPKSFKFPFINLSQNTDNLSLTRRNIVSLANILEESKDLFGVDQKKTYLVLFQNNRELRPTGGTIKAYALATFESGRLSNIDVQDVLFADNQLKGHVDPPDPIKKSGQDSWFLKDSNWSPDFPTSAGRAIWFIDKELGTKVDGVIAVDLEFAKRFIEKIGPLQIDEIGQTVNESNLYEVAQADTSGNNFIAALNKKILNLITELPGKYLIPTFETALSTLNERHLAIWTGNKKVDQSLAKSGWDGSVGQVVCKQESSCVSDYLQIVDANIQANNQPISRSYSLEIFPTNQKMSHRLLISYESSDLSKGDYKNYLRVLVPKGSTISLASMIDPDTGEQTGVSVDEGQEKGKKSFGILATVPEGKKRQLIILWDLEEKLANNGDAKVAGAKTGEGELVFLWQKQMGVLADPASLVINLPKSFAGKQTSPNPSLTQEGSMGYNVNLSQDLLVNISWQPKR